MVALLILLQAPIAAAQNSDLASLDTFVAAFDDAAAQDTETALTKPKFDIYGFAMLDTGYQSGQNDPNWFDVVRPTKLPAFENQFGEDGRWFAGVRQSRFGAKSYFPTDLGELMNNI